MFKPHFFSLLTIFVISQASAAEFTISPGQKVRIGSDTVSCVGDGGGGGAVILFTGYYGTRDCVAETKVGLRFLIDWASRETSIANCEKNKFGAISIGAYKLGTGACIESRSTLNYCDDIVNTLFGSR